MTTQEAWKEERNAAYNGAVSHSVKGLYTFQAAATILRIAHALGELDSSVVDVDNMKKQEVLDQFMHRLNLVERNMRNIPKEQDPPSYAAASHRHPKTLLVAVEGLDGSGKSSLVESLAQFFNAREGVTNFAWATPTASMSSVRPVFDKRGGPVARAFYMVSNYFLQDELQACKDQFSKSDNKKSADMLIIVVDRWYTSTVAYSVAWKHTSGTVESVNTLDDSIFAWPEDLRSPDFLLLLQVDEQVRKDRVKGRNQQEDLGGKENYNPWDDRLDQDENLGKRIMRSFERVAEGLSQSRGAMVVLVNANESQLHVLEEATHALEEYCLRNRNPLQYFDKDPLSFFTWVSSELRLCDFTTGRRLRHAPWVMQVASIGKDGDILLLKTVGIHTTNQAGILFFSRDEFPEGRGGSVVWVGGDYPYEQQWKLEGFLLPVHRSVIELLEYQLPPSLVAYATACHQYYENSNSKSDNFTLESPDCLINMAQRYRSDPPRQQDQVLFATRFVPLRMEVLMGGPSSPEGPHRYEWTRQRGNVDVGNGGGWSRARPILPFRSPQINRSLTPQQLQKMTIAITGTHCAGKFTLGKLVSTTLRFSFHRELGDILRDEPDLVPGGHRTGDGSGQDNARTWDDRIYEAEVQRDRDASLVSRLVETWHVGNLAWALMRLDANSTSGESVREKHWKRTRASIQEEMSKRCVLAVHLTIRPEDCLRRRQHDRQSATRVPMAAESEAIECTELHQALDIRVQSYLKTLQNDMGFPLLILDNSDDSGQEENARKIVNFINDNQWRRAS